MSKFRGKYKMKGDDDPLTFLLACIGIPAGLLLTFIGGRVLVQIIVGHFKKPTGADEERIE